MRDVIVMMMIIIVVIVAIIVMMNGVSFHVTMAMVDSVAFGMNVVHVSFGGRSVEVIASTVDAR